MWRKKLLFHFSGSIRESPITLTKFSDIHLRYDQKAVFSRFISCLPTTDKNTVTSIQDKKKIKPLNVQVHSNQQNFRRFSTTTSTVDDDEIRQFQRFGATWWDEYGPMKPLHSMNRLRIPFIRDGLINTNAVPKERVNFPKPLNGISILDVGCGGGILSEPLAKLGAKMTGIDANCDIIEYAKCHAKQSELNIEYFPMSIEDHKITNSGKYDAVVASEIVEHVYRKNDFIECCVSCLKPGGSIFITTLNKTMIGNILTIIIGEGFGLIPKGTHQYEKFIEPHKLQRILEDNNCKTELIHGMWYMPITNTWSWCSDTSMNYSIHATKL